MRWLLLVAVAAFAMAFGPIGENPVEASARLRQIMIGVGRTDADAAGIGFWASKMVGRGVADSTATDVAAVFARDRTLTVFQIAQLLSVFPAFQTTIGYPPEFAAETLDRALSCGSNTYGFNSAALEVSKKTSVWSSTDIDQAVRASDCSKMRAFLIPPLVKRFGAPD